MQKPAEDTFSKVEYYIIRTLLILLLLIAVLKVLKVEWPF